MSEDQQSFSENVDELVEQLRNKEISSTELISIIQEIKDKNGMKFLEIFSAVNLNDISLESIVNIFTAIGYGFFEKIADFLKQISENLTNNQKSIENMTTFIYKTVQPSIAIINSTKFNLDSIAVSLITKYPNLIESKDENNYTPLIHAAENGNLNAVRLLLERNADVNAKTCYESTALHRACANGFTEIIELLVEKGANVDEPDDEGLRPLHYCVMRDYNESLRKLLALNANPNIQNNRGETPLQMSVRCKSLKCFDILNGLLPF